MVARQPKNKVKGHERDTIHGIHAQISKKLQTPLKTFYVDKNKDIMYVDSERHR